jgi:deazaflavin-dependent oxidoreductase (nitroreductase family)
MNPVEHIATLLTRKGWNPRVIRAVSRFHKFLFCRLGFGHFHLIGEDTLILTTCGRKTGRATSTPLFHADVEGRLYVAASFAGSDPPPNWYLNLTAHPEVTVETRRSRGRYVARTLGTDEAGGFWPKLDAIYPTYAKYRKRTSRVIPVVELSPLPAGAAQPVQG